MVYLIEHFKSCSDQAFLVDMSLRIHMAYMHTFGRRELDCIFEPN